MTYLTDVTSAVLFNVDYVHNEWTIKHWVNYVQIKRRIRERTYVCVHWSLYTSFLMVRPSLKPGSAWWEVYEKINSTVSRELKQKSNKCTVIKKRISQQVVVQFYLQRMLYYRGGKTTGHDKNQSTPGHIQILLTTLSSVKFCFLVHVSNRRKVWQSNINK
jgi:hypothetical protein